MSTSLSIIIPTYNEEGNVVLLYEQILEVLKQEGVVKMISESNTYLLAATLATNTL
jgi:hypothetical protein